MVSKKRSVLKLDHLLTTYLTTNPFTGEWVIFSIFPFWHFELTSKFWHQTWYNKYLNILYPVVGVHFDRLFFACGLCVEVIWILPQYFQYHCRPWRLACYFASSDTSIGRCYQRKHTLCGSPELGKSFDKRRQVGGLFCGAVACGFCLRSYQSRRSVTLQIVFQRRFNPVYESGLKYCSNI